MAGYQSVFTGSNPNVVPNSGGKANPFSGDFQPGKYAAINAQIAASQPKPVPTLYVPPKPGLFSQLANKLGNVVSPTSKGQIAANKSLDASQSKLLQVLNDPKIPIQNKQGVYKAYISGNDPKAAAANTAAVTAATNVPGKALQIGKSLVAAPMDIYHQAATQGKYLFGTPPASAAASNIMSLQKQAQQAAASGRFDQKTIDKIGQVQSPQAKLQIFKALASPKTTDSQIASLTNTHLKMEDARNKQGIGDALQVAALAAGGGETASIADIAKDVTLAKGLAINTGAGIAGNVGAQLSSNPQASGKQLFKAAGTGAAFGAGSTLLGAGLHTLNSLRSVDAPLTEKVTQTAGEATPKTPNISISPPKTTLATMTTAMGADAAPVAEQNFAANKAPAFTKQIEDTLNKVKPVNATTSNAKGALGEIHNLFTPGGGTEGKQIANDLRATTGEQALVKNQATIAAKGDINFFKQFKPGENANFIQKIESGVKQVTPELQAQADKLRTAQEADYALGKSIKPSLVHVENYFPRAGFWNNSSQQVQSFLDKWSHPTLGGKPSALEQRAFPTVYDGIKAGLTPKETNPAIIALNSRTQLLRAKAAQDFFQQQTALGRDPTLVNEYIDRVLGKGLQGSASFKTVKDATYALNNLQLGFSGFHVASTGINASVSQFANGLQDLAHGNVLKGLGTIAKSPTAPLDYLFKGSKILKDYRAGNVTQDIRNIAEGGGRIGQQVDYKTSGLAKSLEQLKSGSLSQASKGVAAAPFRAFSTAAKPIMEYWVPRIKAGATKELIDRKLSELGPNASQDAVRAAKADAIDSIDNRFGQLVKDNLLWKKTVKDFSGLAMRSPGWNIGTVRELGGGLKDLATQTTRGKGLSERGAYTASLAATTMGIGTALSYMFTGKGPQSAIDYFYPKTGKTDKNGNAERVALPTYAKDIFSFVHNPGQTLSNKANPLISTTIQAKNNKDYFGNMVRNPQDSLATQAKQTLQFAGKSALPFSLSNANQRVDKGAGTKAQSFFGLNPAPGYITKSPFEQRVQSALNTALGSKPLTPEQQTLVNTKSQAKQSAQVGSNTGIQKLVDSGQITAKQGKDLQASSQQTSLANQFAYLLKVDRPAAARLISQANPQDIAKLGDLNKLTASLNKTQYNKNAKQSTKDASKTLLQVLNKKR